MNKRHMKRKFIKIKRKLKSKKTRKNIKYIIKKLITVAIVAGIVITLTSINKYTEKLYAPIHGNQL